MRCLLTFSYDGNLFYGYQKQVNQRSVQEEIEKVLSIILNSNITIHASGRTDAKVHAINQKAHFDLDKTVDYSKLRYSMNKMLPKDIYIKSIEQVKDNFHARFDVKKKIYLYKLNMGEYNPLDRNYCFQYNKKLDISAIKEATKYLIGTHNFKSFSKTTDEKKDYTRTIFDIEINEENDILKLKFSGTGFLRYMVRNMVGTLIAVGEHKILPSEIEKIISLENRKEAFLTSNPEGLYLFDVYYK